MAERRPFWNALVAGLKLIPQVVRNGWMPLLTLHILDFAVGQIFSQSQEKILARGDEALVPLAGLMLGNLAFESLWTAAWLLSVLKAVSRCGVNSAHRTLPVGVAYRQIIIESLRSLALVIRWLPALILPALWQYVRLLWVPFVVTLDPEYAKGNVDALKQSAQLVRGRWFFSSLVLVLSAALSPFISECINGGNDDVLAHPWLNILASSSSLALNLFMTLFLFSLFCELRPMNRLAEAAAIPS